MSLMGTLAKLAIGYAAARGVDHLSGGGGLANLFGGAQVSSDEAEADHAPGMVVSVMQEGYVIKGRLLRPAMVTVAKAGGAAPASVDTEA